MPEADAAAAFPLLQQNDWNLVDGTALLSVTVQDGSIVSIVYSPSNAED